MEQQESSRQLIRKLISNQNRKMVVNLSALKSKQERLENSAKNFFAIALLFSIFFGLALMAFYKHAEQMDRQTVVAIKGGVK